MATETLNLILLMAGALAGGALIATVLLRAWHDWLELKRMQLSGERHDVIVPHNTGGRIELADLKERVRKLEAIAAGIDL